MNNVYFVGTAGSGKSTMVGAFKKWLDDNEIDSIIINLDPGAEKLPYVPDIDIREWINLEDVMSQCGLGPNGAQIAAADLMAVNIDKISSVLDTYDVDYVLIDTPGQLELFAFRESSQVVVKALGKERSLMVYLSDPTLYRSANGFVSTMTLASLVQFRMNMPIINLLSKADVLKENEIDRIIDWYNNPDSLYGCLLDEDKDPESVIGMELFRGVVREACAIATAKGVPFDPVEFENTHLKNFIDNMGDYYPSMAQDMLINHRQTEIEVLNGKLSEYGKQFGIPTPVNDLLTVMVKAIQGNYDKQYLK